MPERKVYNIYTSSTVVVTIVGVYSLQNADVVCRGAQNPRIASLISKSDQNDLSISSLMD